MKRKVILEGELGDKYFREKDIVADTFTDVFRCLEANYGDFMQYLADCHEKGIGFILHIEDKPVSDEVELLIKNPAGTMTITPAPAGAKGALKIIAAIAIIVVTAGWGATLAAGGTFGSAFASFAAFKAGLAAAAGTLGGLLALGVAVSLALTGIQEMMAPDPATDKTSKDKDNVFQGADQTIVEGDPVPVLYGKLRIPGRPISFDLRNKSGSFVNYTRVATSNYDTGANYVDNGLYTGGGSMNSGPGNYYSDEDFWYVNLETQNRGFNAGGSINPINPNDQLH